MEHSKVNQSTVDFGASILSAAAYEKLLQVSTSQSKTISLAALLWPSILQWLAGG